MADLGSMISGAVAGTLGPVAQIIATHMTNKSNQEINTNNIDFQKSQTQAQWERDDNAHQREVEDLIKAGLSPLASTQGAMNSQALGAPSPIAMQAPQIDINGLVETFSNAARIKEEKRHNLEIEKARNTELDNQAAEIKVKADSLKLENKKVEEQIRYQTKLNEIACKNLAEIERAHKKDEELRLSAQESLDLERETKRLAQEIARQTGNKDVPVKYCYSLPEYRSQMQILQAQLENLINKLGATTQANAQTKSRNGGAGLGANLNSAAAGVGGNINGNFGKSDSFYNMSDISEKQKIIIDQFYSEIKWPVYIDKTQYKYADKLFNEGQ